MAGRLGTITLQAFDESDIFLREDVYMDGVTDPREQQCEPVQEPGFEFNKAWETGHVPKEIPVFVEGDSSVIIGWFKSEMFPAPFTIKVYIVYDDGDEVIDKEDNEAEP